MIEFSYNRFLALLLQADGKAEDNVQAARLTGAFLSLLVLLASAQARGQEQSEPEHAFSRLSHLVGSWKRAGSDGTQFRIEFELTANGTVLVERWVHRGKSHSLTLYHLDGATLMATHYCPQGNQPRLRMTRSGDRDRFSFEFHDATNLQSVAQSHQHRLSFDLTQADRIVRGEAYRQGDASEQTELTLVRIP